MSGEIVSILLAQLFLESLMRSTEICVFKDNARADAPFLKTHYQYHVLPL